MACIWATRLGLDNNLLVMTPRCAGLPAVQGAFRGLGDTRTPLNATLLCNTINIVLNYILLFVLHWGVAGSAWATVTAEVLPLSSVHSPDADACSLQQLALEDAALPPSLAQYI